MYDIDANLNKLKDELLSIKSSIESPKCRKQYIFGAGNTSVLSLKSFQRENIEVTAFVDSDPEKQRNGFYGKKVLSPDEKFDSDSLMIINSMNTETAKQIAQLCDSKGFSWVTLDAYVFSKNIDKLMSAISMLSDDLSKEIFINLVSCRLHSIIPPEGFYSPDHYFAIKEFEHFDLKGIFANLGACTGEELEPFLDRTKIFETGKILCFEPDAQNLSIMEKRIAKIEASDPSTKGKIIPVCAGVGKTTTTVSINSGKNEASNLVEGLEGTQIKIYSLDDYIADDEKVDFIKADIESFELDALIGAERIIKHHKPKLAVAIYHNPSDMLDMIQYIHSIVPEYKLSVRHHTKDLSDTVLYAYL